ncbi:MAG: hypothetical protein CVV02_08080 [Firmicutes bacterium HGW-Firmicutes-7]|nr:MAG: hypothetical protein CVV02_08080 [Firmicutes bacterium HGW-Firmicutes-7]
MIEAIIVKGLEKVKDINVVREDIELMLADGVNFFENDSLDQTALHVIVYEEKQPVATGRLLNIELNNYVIDKICVKINKRRLYYGDLVVKMLIDKAFNIGAKEVVALVPNDGIGFFTRIGFSIVDENNSVKKLCITKDAVKKCKH